MMLFSAFKTAERFMRGFDYVKAQAHFDFSFTGGLLRAGRYLCVARLRQIVKKQVCLIPKKRKEIFLGFLLESTSPLIVCLTLFLVDIECDSMLLGLQLDGAYIIQGLSRVPSGLLIACAAKRWRRVGVVGGVIEGSFLSIGTSTGVIWPTFFSGILPSVKYLIGSRGRKKKNIKAPPIGTQRMTAAQKSRDPGWDLTRFRVYNAHPFTAKIKATIIATSILSAFSSEKSILS